MAPMQKPGRFCTETGISIFPFSSLHRDTQQDLEVSRDAGQASACGLSRRSRSPPRGRPRPPVAGVSRPRWALWRGRESPREAPQVPWPWSSAAPAAAAFAAGRRGCWGPGGEGPRFPAAAQVGKRGGRSPAGSRKRVRGDPASGPRRRRPPPAPHCGRARPRPTQEVRLQPEALAQGQLPLQKPGQWD